MAEMQIPSAGSSEQVVSEQDEYSNPEFLTPGAIVRLSGADEIRRADNGSIATAPARAVLISQSAVAVATILYEGEAAVFSGLVPGAEYFLGPAGNVIQSSGLPTTAGSVIQRLGTAKNSTTLLFSPSQPVEL